MIIINQVVMLTIFGDGEKKMMISLFDYQKLGKIFENHIYFMGNINHYHIYQHKLKLIGQTKTNMVKNTN